MQKLEKYVYLNLHSTQTNRVLYEEEPARRQQRKVEYEDDDYEDEEEKNKTMKVDYLMSSNIKFERVYS